MLQVCPNGARSRVECDRLPLTATELAAEVRSAVRAGAEDAHLHPKDSAGRDTLEPEHVAAAVAAVRAAVPGVRIGVTTGAWAAPDPERRAAHVRAWTVLPDHASVNWHEDGADLVADALLARGVGIEVGIFSGTDAARRFLAWPRAHRALRVLAEITETEPAAALVGAEALLDTLRAGTDLPVLLHGEDGSAWPVLAMAAARGLDTRIGLEDVLHLPDGSPARDNAELVRSARKLIDAQSGGRPLA